MSIGKREVWAHSFSFGKGTGLSGPSGPQGSISSFQPQTRGSVQERSEDMSQCLVLGHTNDLYPGGEDWQS